MRIRSIRPEFWRSGSISRLPIEDRLLFIGIWSYVDDNGVGLDRLSNLAADLFADDLENNPRDTFARVSRGLASLSATGRIKRYTVAGRDYLYVVNWDEHQKIDRPGKERYPLPTREDAEIRETFATPSRDIRDIPSTGEGEKGRRGEGEKDTSSNADAFDGEFDEFWQHYPRKVGKGQARNAYRTARKKAPLDQIASALRLYCQAVAHVPADKIRHPATWLNGEPWEDDPAAIAPARFRRNNDIDWDAAMTRATEADRNAS